MKGLTHSIPSEKLVRISSQQQQKVQFGCTRVSECCVDFTVAHSHRL